MLKKWTIFLTTLCFLLAKAVAASTDSPALASSSSTSSSNSFESSPNSTAEPSPQNISSLNSSVFPSSPSQPSSSSPSMSSNTSSTPMPSNTMPSSSPSSASLPVDAFSPSSLSSSSSSMASSSNAAVVSSSAISSLSSVSSQAPILTTSSSGQTRKLVTSIDPTYIPMVAAIVSGFCLLVLLVLLLTIMALVYRHLGKKDEMMAPMKKPKKTDGGLYAVQESSQSAQYLVSSMSIPSFGSSPSDVRLDAHVPQSPSSLVYYNRGMDANGSYDHEEGYKPIQIVAADVPARPKSSSKV